MQIEQIKKLVAEWKIKWSNNCLERMGERDISRADVKNCISSGEIIEVYPDEYPHPRYLIYGKDLSGEVIHVVVGSDGTVVDFITAYVPDIEKFEEDLKTRRE